MNTKKMLVLLSSTIILLIFTACENDSSLILGDEQIYKSGTGVESKDILLFDISPEEKDGLVHMRLEEKLARDVYTTLGDLWNNKTFLNIKLSEQKHFDSIKRLLIKYEIPDPIISDEVGVFPNPEFQTLYDQFVLQGSYSLYEAFLVGKIIEEIDIADLEFQLSFVDNPDIINVYQNLKTASISHLAAFNNCINSNAQL